MMNHFMSKMSGRLKEATGKATGNKKLELRGKIQSDIADLKYRARYYLDGESETTDW